jgi:hypothetical protein
MSDLISVIGHQRLHFVDVGVATFRARATRVMVAEENAVMGLVLADLIQCGLTWNLQVRPSARTWWQSWPSSSLVRQAQRAIAAGLGRTATGN